MSNSHNNKWFANLLQGGLLLLLLLLASYVTIGRILIANVDTYRTQITSLLSGQLGTEVQIGRLAGDWSYLNPTLTIEQLFIGDEQEVSVEVFTVTVDVIASLTEQTLILREVFSRGLRLELVNEQDRWVVKGLPAAEEPFDPMPLVKSLGYLVALDVDDIRVGVIGSQSRFVLRSDPERPSEVRRVGEVLSLALPLKLEDSDGEHNLLFAGQYQSITGSDERNGELYLKLPELKVTEFVSSQQLESLGLSAIRVGGEVWFDIEGDQIDVRGDTSLSLRFVGSDHTLNTTHLIGMQGRLGGELVGSIAELSGEFAGVEFGLANIGVSYEPGPKGDQLSLQIPELDLQGLLSTPLELGRLGIGLTSEQVETLAALNPSGQLRSVMAILRLGDALDYRIVSGLQAVKVERFKALPTISDLNGLVHITPEGGFLDVINERPFILQFPNMFKEQWYFDEARTRIAYEVSDVGLHAYSSLVDARWGELIANGSFHLKIADDPLLTTWGLELGVQDANLLEAFRYLPHTVKDDVQDWLVKSILAGRSNESGMIFHGSLAKQAAKDQKAHQLYFEVTDAILDYDSNWPRFDNLAATIFIDNFEISSNDASGLMFDSEVLDASVMVPVSADGVADSILIEGRVNGLLSDGIRVLTETPLVEATSEMAVGWLAAGDMAGSASLDIPIGPRSERGEPVWADVSVVLDGATVNMTQFDLNFEQIKGAFRYETDTALQSDGFTAVLFGKPVDGAVASSGDREQGEIVVQLDGKIDAQDLYRWSDQPLFTRASGVLSYESELHVFYGAIETPIFVTAVSDMVGVALDLPMPIGKPFEQPAPLFYKQTFFDDRYWVEMSLAETVRAKLEVIEGSLAGGLLHFGDSELDDVSFDKINVTGQLDRVVYEHWDKLSSDLESVSEGSLEEELEQTLDKVDLQIELFDVFGFEMDAVQTVITRDPGYWHVDLSNSWLAGRVSVSDDDNAPLILAMDRLAFESQSTGESEEADPFNDVAPADLARAQFSVDQLILDGEDYGRWAFLYEPKGNMAMLSDLEIDVRGLNVAEGAVVRWTYDEGQHSSEFDGTVLIPDLGSALEQWGYASSIEGQDFSLYGDVTWPGSPAMVDLEVIDGLIRIMEGEGRFVQAENNMGALNLLGIFDFASLARRFRLDFSDVVDTGFSFSSIEGETRFTSGVVDVVDPILIEGSGSIFKVAGRVDLTSQELDNDMIVTLPVNRNLPWYAAYSAFATGPLTGAGVFLANRLFQNQINAISSAKYKITGTMDEPIIEFVSIFSDSVREAPEVESSQIESSSQ